MKILSFPSPCWRFEATAHIPKGRQTEPVHMVGFLVVITAPIDIHHGDMLIVDIRNGAINSIERGGFVIWREAWKN